MEVRFSPSSRVKCPECETPHELNCCELDADDYTHYYKTKCSVCKCEFQVELHVDCEIYVDVGKIETLKPPTVRTDVIDRRLKELEPFMLDGTATEAQRHEWRKLILELEEIYDDMKEEEES